MGRTAQGQLAMINPEVVAEHTIRPMIMQPAVAQPALAEIRQQGRPFYLIACYGANSVPGNAAMGQRVADTLRRPVVAFYNEVRTLNKSIQPYAVYHALERPGGFEEVYGNIPSRRFDPLEAMDWQ